MMTASSKFSRPSMRFGLPASSIFTVVFITLVLNQQIGKSQFEAAFQGNCGQESPCEHLCYEIHDGMFECYCKEGYVLHKNGYSCIDTTPGSDMSFDDGDDILYQKDASFSAILENTDSSPDNNNSSVDDDELLSAGGQPDETMVPQFSKSTANWTTDRPWTTAQIGGHRDGTTSASQTNASSDLSSCNKYCGPFGSCTIEPAEPDDVSNQRCQCPLGKGGENCEVDVEIRIPRFTGQGWIAFPALRAAYKHVQVEIEFRPENWDGIIFLTGERDDLAGDFISLLLYQGFVEFRFDCGSGVGVVRSDETVLLNRWNRLIIYRHRWDAWIQLNNGRHVQGRSKICMELWPSEVVGNVFFLTINVGFCYLIPLSVIIVCYSYIWNCVNERIVPGNELNSHYAMLRRCKMKVTGMTLRVIILFAISWLWLYLVFLWIKLDFPYSDVAQAFIPIAQWLGVSNSCVNPILYAYYNSKFNVGFVSIVMKNSCCCKPKTYYSVASQIYRKRADNSKKPNIRMTVAVSQNVEQRDRTRVGRQQHPDLPQYPRNRCVKVKKTLSLDPEFFLDRKSDYPDFVIESELDKIFPS